MPTIGVALIGTGKIALANHVPGLRLHPAAKLVALADPDQRARDHAARGLNLPAHPDYRDVLKRDDVHAVIVATPNFVHEEIVTAAAQAGKHVMCEKPIALDYPAALRMVKAADAAGVRHMTAFTYRFVPAMRYLKHLVDAGLLGTPYHFRARRFQDWGDRFLAWRQSFKLAGSGEMGDMLSHRIDYAHHLVGPTNRLVADMRNFVPTRGNQPSDVDDWISMLTEYDNPDRTTGVLESTKLAAGRGEGHRGEDIVELNGSEASAVYSTQKPLELWIGKQGDPDLTRHEVPKEFLVYPGSTRNPSEGDPLATFRYDQSWEFIQSIADNRPASPSLADGAATQRVMDAALLSTTERRWVDITEIQ